MPRKHIGWFLFGVLALLALLKGNQKNQQPERPKGHVQEHDELVMSEAAVMKEEHSVHQAHHKTHYPKQPLDIVGCATLGLLVVNILLYCATDKAANAATKSANAAKDALISQSAFVYNEPIAWDAISSGIFFSVRWKNGASTAATDAHCFVNSLQGHGKNGIPDWFPFPDFPNESNSGATNEFFLGPQQMKPCGPLFFASDRVSKIGAPDYHTLIYGWITYTDVFRHTHITRFATQIVSMPAENTFEFRDWGRFNCTDEQCERQENEAYAKMPPQAVAVFPRDKNPRRPPERALSRQNHDDREQLVSLVY